MKLDAPVNPNYAATVVRVRHLVDLPNADNLVGFPIMGMQAIVGKDTEVGQLGILIPTECQLSEEYCRVNNLFRHGELNTDKTKVGYVEDNRRVRAIKLRGNRSDALYMPLVSLAHCGVDVGELTEGATFDKLGDHEICRKYEIERRVGIPRSQKRIKRRVDQRYLPEHFDSENFFRIVERLDLDAPCILTQKIHGTSIRIGNTIVERKLTLRDRIAKFFGAKVQETEFDMVYGSRKVIKDANNPNQDHFYDSDIWTREGKKLNDLVPENYIVYGELIGWASKGKPIQHNYTYNLRDGECELYVYRVAVVNRQGLVVDLSWDALKEFCRERALKWVPEITRTTIRALVPDEMNSSNGLLDQLLDENFSKLDIDWSLVEEPVPLSTGSPCDEGVCIRIEGIIPQIYKAKSPIFLQHETKLLDKGQEDLESSQTEGDDNAGN